MDNLQFYEYVLSLLAESGHVITSLPVYANHTSRETLYIDSTKDVMVSYSDRELLSLIDNVSLISDIRWKGIVDELSENVQIFSITVNFPKSERSQNVADIHQLLQMYWNCTHSIVFFKNHNSCVVSFADNSCSHILSDWWDIGEDFYTVAERINIGNISVENSEDYFLDFIYACAREYYIYPISFEEASYGLIPLDYISKSLISDIPATREYLKEIIQHNLITFEERYGDDYVEPVYTGIDDIVKYHNISDEIDRISFELELGEENDVQFEGFDFTDDDAFDEDDDYDEDVDPAIFDDPVLMVKWLEKRQKGCNDSFDASRDANEKFQEQVHIGAERRGREYQAEQSEHDQQKAEYHDPEGSEAEQGQIAAVTLTSIRDYVSQLRDESNRKKLDAENKRQKADQLKYAYDELVLRESERKKQAKIAFETLAAAKQKATQLRVLAQSKRIIADNKHCDAEGKRQTAERLAEKFGELTRFEANRKARKEAERKAYEEVERKAREEAERKERELKRLAAEYTAQIAAIQKKYGIELESAKDKFRLNASRLLDIDKRLAQLNFLQFSEKRNLRNEKEELERQQKTLSLRISKIEHELADRLEQENKRFNDAVSLV